MPATQETRQINGVPVDRLEETIAAVQADPELGRSEFRVRNRWIGGGQNRSTVQNFFSAGEERVHEEPFVVDNGEPPVLLGTDDGANPAEHVLSALAGCVTRIFVYYAAAPDQGELDQWKPAVGAPPARPSPVRSGERPRRQGTGAHARIRSTSASTSDRGRYSRPRTIAIVPSARLAISSGMDPNSAWVSAVLRVAPTQTRSSGRSSRRIVPVTSSPTQTAAS